MIRYFQTNNGYHGVTEKSAKGMKNVVLVGRGPDPGKGIESVREQVYVVNQLDKMTAVKPEDVPDDWFYAIGLEGRRKKFELTVIEKFIIIMVAIWFLMRIVEVCR